MKRKINSLFYLLLTFIFCTCFFVGCGKTGNVKASIEQTTDDMVVIKVDEVKGEVTLLSVMEKLKEDNEIDFTIEGGMITEINKTANTVDFSACWMLYTSDTELSNTSWGTISYEGQVYGSAITGAEELLVIEDTYYIWSYKSF